MKTRLTILLFFLVGITLGQNDSLPVRSNADKEQFAEIGGKKQFYLSKGVGNPVIVFVSGLGPTMDDLFEIQNELSKTTRVLCYDRAGIGRSESFNNERNLENITFELKELLDKAGVDKPFILAGHSRGALIAQYFANKYPASISALILIDPAIPELIRKKRELRTDPEKKEFDTYYDSFCSDTAKYSATIRNEFKNTFTTDSKAIAGKYFSRNIPITIIASTKINKDKYSKAENNIKVDLLNNYIKSAPQIKLILTNKSGHFIYDDEPTLVNKAIISMVEKIKTRPK